MDLRHVMLILLNGHMAFLPPTMRALQWTIGLWSKARVQGARPQKVAVASDAAPHPSSLVDCVQDRMTVVQLRFLARFRGRSVAVGCCPLSRLPFCGAQQSYE